jgi:two-component system competent response regulator ComA
MLTEVEGQVLDWLARGYTHDQAARMLRMTPGGVQAHERAIYEKLHVNSRCEAVREAMRWGWLVD